MRLIWLVIGAILVYLSRACLGLSASQNVVLRPKAFVAHSRLYGKFAQTTEKPRTINDVVNSVRKREFGESSRQKKRRIKKKIEFPISRVNELMSRGSFIFLEKSLTVFQRAKAVRTKIQIVSSKSINAYVDGIFSIMCVVTEHVLPPVDFYWFHNGSKIDLASHRGGGIYLENTQHHKSSSSLLKIVYSNWDDSGLYECQPVGKFEDAIVLRNFSMVHVEERPKSSFFSHAGAFYTWDLLFFICFFFITCFA